MDSIQLTPIAHIKTCYDEKFGIPRQSGIVEEAWGRLVFEPDFRTDNAVRGLEGFSHLWLVFIFHQSMRKKWNPTVRPPRLGGNERVGVFASRSPYRPNPIGLSVVTLHGIDFDDPEGPVLHVRGVDLVNGTPIVDIKPYIPYADALPDAKAGFAPSPPERLDIKWKNNAGNQLDPKIKELLESTLAIDPRPAYQKDESREYGCLISGYNIRWIVQNKTIIILSVQ